MYILGAILSSLIMIAFAYLVYLYAKKEKGNLKTIGEVIVCAIVVIDIIILLVGVTSKPKYPSMEKGGKMIHRMK